MNLRPDRLFRCATCGGWRYYLNKPCHTCEVLARRNLIRGSWGRP